MRLDHSYYKDNYRCLLYEMYNEYNAKYENRRAFNLATNFKNATKPYVFWKSFSCSLYMSYFKFMC